ncbi:hypothetical protein [Streptomyces sp. IBSBF 2435]|uniref:hypothetical protein n=1 Tax=Streptomyces sp. IBSBF 2435 TaxID=2903531 RepID=UPI002FDBC47D
MRIARTSPGGSVPVRVTAMGAATAAALLVAGCSSGSGGGGSTSLKALGHLRADANASKTVTYLDSARVRKLGAADPKRFSSVGQPGSGLLGGYEPAPWGPSVTAARIDTAVDSNVSGHWDGSFDTAAITASLKKNGYTSLDQDGEQVWKPADGDSGPRFVFSRSEIRYATGSTPFSAVDPGHDDSLAGQQDYRVVADCLGDVYRADFNALTAAKPVRLSALGQQADDAGKNTEVLCVAVKDRATADRLADTLRTVVKDQAPRFAGTAVTVDKGDHPVVRASVPDTSAQRPGRLFLTDMQLWLAVGRM